MMINYTQHLYWVSITYLLPAIDARLISLF